MFIDFRSSEVETDIRCDICIVGGGAAGITLACALIGSGIDVCLLESGGFEFLETVQSLYSGEAIGMENASPTRCRLRYFGGTTNHWAGWCAPMEAVDFERRAWIPESGWPLSKVELLQWYEKAQVICQLGKPGYQADTLRAPAHNLPSIDPEKANVRYFRFSPPTRFGQVYRTDLEEADNVRVFLNANVLMLKTNGTATEVREVKLRTLEGKNGSVRASIVVLACGGMENARQLLLANEVESSGLGNESGRLGRYFMQHIEGTVARIMTRDLEHLERNFSRFASFYSDSRAELSLSAQAQEKARILNSGFTVDVHPEHGIGYLALSKLWSQLRNGNWPQDFAQRLGTVLNDLGSVSEIAYKPDSIAASLYARAESLPNAESTVSLGSSRDIFGLPRIKVNWQLTPFDKHSLIKSIQTIATEFGRLDIGRFELAEWVTPGNNSWPSPLWGGCHHMGTTRMSGNPDMGIVDRNCRMHSVGNLYVAGSSVFPTASYVPPTLTIVALALRLAEHLHQQFHAN